MTRNRENKLTAIDAYWLRLVRKYSPRRLLLAAHGPVDVADQRERLNSATAGSKQWGNLSLGDVRRTGDLDGDGIADLIVWRASTGTWHWLTSSSGYLSGDGADCLDNGD